MSKAIPRTPKNTGLKESSLTKPQKTALEYWNRATLALEHTSRSVLDVFRRHNDRQNYAKYEHQFNDFTKMRDILSKNVEKAIESKNVRHMETVIIEAIKKLKTMMFLHPDQNNKLKRSMSEEYDQALMALTKCITELRMKIKIIDKCLNRVSVEMRLYDALAKELQSLLKATLKAKVEKRENVAKTVIDLAPEVMSYIKTKEQLFPA